MLFFSQSREWWNVCLPERTTERAQNWEWHTHSRTYVKVLLGKAKMCRARAHQIHLIPRTINSLALSTFQLENWRRERADEICTVTAHRSKTNRRQRKFATSEFKGKSCFTRKQSKSIFFAVMRIPSMWQQGWMFFTRVWNQCRRLRQYSLFIFPGCHFCGGINVSIGTLRAATRWVCEDNYSSGSEEDILAQETDLIFGETKDAGNDTPAALLARTLLCNLSPTFIHHPRAHNSPGTDIWGAFIVCDCSPSIYLF